LTRSWLARLVSGDSLRLLREHVVAAVRIRAKPITSRAEFQRFLDSRASFVAQTTLYGYLRARAGSRFPELFDNETFVRSINIAKWPIWLACLSDLSIYAGGLVAQRTAAAQPEVAGLMNSAVDAVLVATGVPGDAGPDFPSLANEVRERVRDCVWESVRDDASPFTESPAALVRWAPIVDEFKRLDERFVKNSVRFRWQEVRRDLRRDLAADAVLASDT
jgi:hypothetical protein